MQASKVEKGDETSRSMRAQAQLLQRFAAIRDFCVARGIKQYGAVFTAVDPTLEEYLDRMRKLWSGDARITEDDEAMIAKMEKVCETLRLKAA